MPRVARIVIPGVPHHIAQRGNNRQDVFFTDDDRKIYLAILKEQSEKYALKIHAYCLMTNHFHLVAVPENEDSLEKAVGRADLIYAQHINRLHGRSGHFWQYRFFSCAMDEQYYIAALIYVERNPVRARMVKHAWQYGWSSAMAHIEGNDSRSIIDKQHLNLIHSNYDWRAALTRPEDKEAVGKLRLHINRGRPLGSDSFLGKLESSLGKRLRPMKVGRPKKGARE